MKTLLSLCLIVFAFCISTCSKTVAVNNAGTTDLNNGTADANNTGTPENKLPLNPEDVSEGDPYQILINDATDLANPNRAESAERLILLAKANKDSYATISRELVDELRTSCGSDDLLTTNAQFTKVQSLAVILAKMKHLGALETLIDCSNRRRNFGGLSYTNYPTVEPIVNFGEMAIPSLISKYHYADIETKCRLASIVTMIGGPKASHSFRLLQRTEVDGTAKRCLENGLRTSANREG